MAGLTILSFLRVGLKVLLAWETLKIFLLTGNSKRNIFCRKKKKNVDVLAPFMISLSLKTIHTNLRKKKEKNY